jgi:DNA helicase-2/ATP-dependent DNA helicase PcrA
VPAWKTNDPQYARLVEAYESELRAKGLVDFDDMPLLAMRALRENEWLRRALLAKYPILIVDEYQDLGRALHGMVMGLCFSTGMRLFAVGDVDQSIYGFTGANPELLKHLSERKDVEIVRLRLNYRCGSRIVTASSYALGEERDYAAPDGAHQGTIYFHPRNGMYAAQAEYLFATVIPEIKKRIPDLTAGEIAILYPAAFIGNDIATAAQNHGYAVVRADTNALYPRNSRLIRWLEQCAVWCCEGWRTGIPRFSKIVGEGYRLFAEVIVTPDNRLSFQRALLALLFGNRDTSVNLHSWLAQIRDEILGGLFSSSRTMDDESETLDALIERTSAGGVANEMTLGHFSGCGDGNDRINLSTLHSSKGREFRVVIMFGMDNGRIPRRNPSEQDLREARRLFYVGFTRAKVELHLMHTNGQASPFLQEVEKRLDEES